MSEPGKGSEQANTDPELPVGAASLKERLDAYTEALQRDEPAFAEAYGSLVLRLDSVFVDTAPKVGDVMPPFLLINENGRMVSLGEILATGPAVLSFNRGHWCDYCDLELAHYARHRKDFERYGTAIISITPEKQIYNRSFREKIAGDIRFLTDIDNGYALSLGLVMPVDLKVRELLLTNQYRIDVYQGNDAWLLPIPATFIVGANGIVVDRLVTVDFRRRMEIDQALAAVRSLQGR